MGCLFHVRIGFFFLPPLVPVVSYQKKKKDSRLAVVDRLTRKKKKKPMLPGRLPYTWRGSHWDGFEWVMAGDGNVHLRDKTSLNEHMRVEEDYTLVDLKSPGLLVHEGISTWRTFRPLAPLPGMMAVNNDEDEYRWYFTLVDPVTFRVHCHTTGVFADESIDDAGWISAPLSRNWRRVRLYAFAIGHFLCDMPRATEKVLRPDGEEARVCAKRFKAMAGPCAV